MCCPINVALFGGTNGTENLFVAEGDQLIFAGTFVSFMCQHDQKIVHQVRGRGRLESSKGREEVDRELRPWSARLLHFANIIACKSPLFRIAERKT